MVNHVIELIMSQETNMDVDSNVNAPDMGYLDVDEFYESISCHKNTANIKIPMLSLNARDDPICPTESIPKESMTEKNENLIHLEVQGGGHVEFLSKLKPRMVSASNWFQIF